MYMQTENNIKFVVILRARLLHHINLVKAVVHIQYTYLDCFSWSPRQEYKLSNLSPTLSEHRGDTSKRSDRAKNRKNVFCVTYFSLFFFLFFFFVDQERKIVRICIRIKQMIILRFFQMSF